MSAASSINLRVDIHLCKLHNMQSKRDRYDLSQVRLFDISIESVIPIFGKFDISYIGLSYRDLDMPI